MPRKEPSPPRFPSPEALREFLDASDPLSLRRLAKAFHIAEPHHKAFKDWLHDHGFRLIRGRVEFRPATHGQDAPEVLIADVLPPDRHGEVQARPADERIARRLPAVLLARDAAPPGARVLLRLEPGEGPIPHGRVIRTLTRNAESVLCLVKHVGSQVHAVPTQRSRIPYFRLDEREAGKLETGAVVRVQPLAGGPRHKEPAARVLEVLPPRGEVEKLGDIAIAEQGIPHVFSASALAVADQGRVPELGKREDLRRIPLVTIDGEDARDFDDAVFAEPDGRSGGWHLIVAIADVAHYVPAGSALDEEALERGNSVYLADQVVPMLPEALSNGLCSLKPDEERACLAVHLWIDAEGRRKEYRFRRGLMRSHARLTYTQVEAFLHGEDRNAVPPSLHRQVEWLHGAFESFMKARRKRGTLELDIPEHKVLFDDKGEVKDIIRRPHLHSHRLIEEFMIAANVAAAELIEKERLPGLFRVHEPPSPEKLVELETMLESARLKLAKPVTPIGLNGLLAKAEGTEMGAWLSMAILRTQSQATYTPKNLGHFGLGLACYAHFTSPIRRYADLVVHRALLGHLAPEEAAPPPANLSSVAEHISMTERRAMVAERDTVDRYAAVFLRERVGASFAAVISGVTSAGVFVTLEGLGASGLVPIRCLGGDYFVHEPKRHRLVGRRSGVEYGLGQRLRVVLAETNGVTGKMTFSLEGGEEIRPEGAFRRAKGGAFGGPARGKSGAGKGKKKEKSGRKRR